MPSPAQVAPALVAIALTFAATARGQDAGSPSELQILESDVRALQRILSEEIPEDVELSTLFEMDLDDENEVARRRIALGERIEVESGRLRELAARLTSTATAARTASTAASGTAAVDLRSLEERLKPGQRDELERMRVRVKRDQLILAVLNLDRTQRQALARAEEKRQAIHEEKAAAHQARAEAEIAAREAEEARRRALEEARQAVSRAEKALAKERARIESMRVQIATLRASFATDREKDAAQAQSMLARERELSQRALDPNLAPGAADALYDEVVGVLTISRGRLNEALGSVISASRVPAVGTELDLDDPIYAALGAKKADLMTSLGELRTMAKNLREEESSARWKRTEEVAKDVEFLNTLRLELIDRLSMIKRESVMGFTREGFGQLRREIQQLTLAARWYVTSTLRTVQNLDRYFSDVVTIGKAGLSLLKLAFLLLALVYTARRYRGWVGRLRGVAANRIRGRQLARFVDRWVRFLQQNGFAVGVLATTYVLFGVEAATPELTLIRSVVVGYAWYRFLMALMHDVIANAARGRRKRLLPETSEKILRTVRLAARYTYAIYVLLVISEEVLGRGYLYRLVVQFFWIGTLPIAFVLIQRWREDIASTYLRLYPNGRFAESVARTRDKAVGFFVAVGAFGSVAARGLTVYSGDVLLRFDQTRKALAFVFRRRLERHADEVGRGTADLANLPPAVEAAFSEEPVAPHLQIDHWPHLDEAVERIAQWEVGNEGLSLALIGERGAGKSSWLLELARRTAVQPRWLRLTRRLMTEEAISVALSEALLEETVRDLEAFATSLENGPKRILIIEHGQDLILRTVGGTAAYEALMNLVARVSHRVMFVVSFSRYAWKFLDQRYRGRNLFTAEYVLDGWPEDAIGQLIEVRMEAAGCEADFRDLLLDPLVGDELQEELARTAERFRRLLWDYADGNPRVAIHYWLRSLVPVPGDPARMKIHLFIAPDDKDLEALEEESTFALASIAIHENLTLDEMASALAYPREVCLAAVGHLRSQGMIAVAEGTYRVTPKHYRSVVRYLRRKNLIHS